jgi:hypothetical protein
MVHPFGNCDVTGQQRLGCFETDELAGVDVYLDGLSSKPKFDKETTNLLREHQAHHHFHEISQRFREYGSIVMLQSNDGQKRFARVSHHYAHIGIATSDGVSVEGVDNLYAVGDASGVGFWTNYRERLPGFALVKCLVDAELTSNALSLVGKSVRVADSSHRYAAENDGFGRIARVITASEEKLRYINTDYLHSFLAHDPTDTHGREGIARSWSDSLQEAEQHEDTVLLRSISLAVAVAHQAIAAGRAEPYKIHSNLGLGGTLGRK